ncbi:uncharacterized protein TRIADDRAFT_30613 [Trichoplax adhaerens]|uniref:alpha-L-fucosidase n=1 Tax=Trichoplax adhaerens TaxID=10228 RepID=B3S7V4_TRIAD|nr:hypothetical protein TRIADDRAFT_30613 [Trichoplax adhaerens]EDV21258.1 hypothetical protein TRIADDRAFT_30613 [Trichoplax adhaerens]|eukprot:XP_002116225.1 hypothetical protein TRIADDRAFT_30613 [Trichoplax adhaerens]
MLRIIHQTEVESNNHGFGWFHFYTSGKKYQPNWKSLDARPLPSWYDKAKVGIFVHWGVFSVPSFDSEWFWWHWKGLNSSKDNQFMQQNYPSGFSYPEFAPSFTAEFFDADAWAHLIENSGAKYVVFTTKHHEGWTNYKSHVSWNWNSVDNGPHRDLTGNTEISNAVRKRTNVTLGLYHSLYEWFNPLYLFDKKNSFKTKKFITETLMPELHYVINQYKPDLLWSDGDWEAPDTYWQSQEFLAWLYNDSPVKETIITNDRWGRGSICHHGGYYTCQDRFDPGVLQKHKWENAMSLDLTSWGFDRSSGLKNYLSMEELTKVLIRTVSCGGNILINIGPTSDGRILPIFQERLTQLGSWLKVNGEGIYNSIPWRVQNDTITNDVWYTERQGTVYAFFYSWPASNKLALTDPKVTPKTSVKLLGFEGNVPFKANSGSNSGVLLDLSSVSADRLSTEWAWAIALHNVH